MHSEKENSAASAYGTRIAGFPWACAASASSAVKTIWPTAAPGDAGKPVAIT
jgi:hypothetical protein